MNVGEQIARGTSWSFLAQVISFGFGFVVSVLLARWLGPESYGLIPLTMTIIAVFGVFADFGVGASSSKYISEYRARDIGLVKSIVKDSFILKLIFGFVISVICFFSAELIVEFMHMPRLLPLLQVSSVMLFFTSFLGFLNAVFQGFQRFEFTALTSFFQNIIKLVASLGLVYLGYGVIGAIAGFTIASIITALLALVIVYFKFYNRLPTSSSNKSMRKDVLKYSAPLAITSISYFIYVQSDILMLGYFTTSSEVGFYSIAHQIINVLLFPIIALQFSIQPMAAYLFGEKSSRSHLQLENVFNYTLKYGLLLTIPTMFCLIAIATPLILVILGSPYTPTITLLTFLSIYLIPRTMLGSTFLIAAGKAGIVSKLTVITAISNFVLNLYMIPHYGALGAVISTLMTHPIHLGVCLIIAKRDFRFSFSKDLYKSILKFIVASIVMYLSITIFLSYLVINLKWLLMAILIGMLIYLFMLFLIRGITNKDLNILKGIIVH